MWQAVYRGHDFYLGLIMEQGKSTYINKGNHQVEEASARGNTEIYVDGRLARSNDEISCNRNGVKGIAA